MGRILSALRAALLGLLGILALTAGWWAVVAAHLVEGIPAPAGVAAALGAELGGATLWSATAHTLTVTLLATAFAGALGVLVGAAVGMSATVGRLLGSSINTLRFVPPVALIPVVLLFLGFSVGSEIAVGTFAALWPVLLNVAAAARGVRERFEDMARIHRVGPMRQLASLYIPGSLVAAATGLRVGAALALILVVAVEMLAVPNGLGHQVRFAGDALQLPTMYAYIVWTGCVGLLLNGALHVLAVLAAGGRERRETE